MIEGLPSRLQDRLQLDSFDSTVFSRSLIGAHGVAVSVRKEGLSLKGGPQAADVVVNVGSHAEEVPRAGAKLLDVGCRPRS